MMTAPEPLGGLVLRLILSVSLMLGGEWVLGQTGLYWVGVFIITLAALLVFKFMWRFLGSALSTSRQIDYLVESYEPSDKYGKARLATHKDRVIQAMHQPLGFVVGALSGHLLFYNPFARGHAHMVTYARTRTGKTACNVLPALLHWFGGSIFITDVKSEVATITAHYRRARNQRIVFLNPFNSFGLGNTPLNPLYLLIQDVVKNAGRELAILARLVALQLLPENLGTDGDDGFFRNGGRREIIAWEIYMAVFEQDNCHLPRLRQLVWSSAVEKRQLAKKMMVVNWFGGVVKEYGNALFEMLNPDYIKTYGGFRDHAMDALEIYDSSTLFGQSIMATEFTLEEALDENTTIYCILPEDKGDTHGRWQGLITTLLIHVISANKKNRPFLLLLEEMGNLSKLANLGKALSLLPVKGVRLWMIFQSPRQADMIYSPAMRRLIEDQCSFIQQWSIRDDEDLRRWSARIGSTTKKARSLSQDARDPVTPWRLNVSERAAPVLNTDEIQRMGQQWQLIAIDGELVVCAEKIPYYQVEPFRSRAASHPYHPEGYPKNEPVRFWV